MVYVVRSLVIALLLGCGGPSGPPSVESEAATFTGTVRETLPAGPYTYLRVHVDGGDERWVVVQGDPPSDRVTLHSFGRRHDFESRRLGRTFDELHFASITGEAP